jgi:mono/diheme cytochrome c family protein
VGASGTVIAAVQSRARDFEVYLASIVGREEIMKVAYLKNVGAIAVVTVLALVFLGSGAAQTDVKFADAASFYKDGKCVVCHGQKAEKKFDAAKNEEELTEIVLKGKKPEKPPNMPAYEAKGITADQAKAMIAYMKSLK